MPQLHLYVSEEIAAALKHRAEARGVTLSKYLAELARRDVGSGWPEGWLEKVYGGWQGEPPERRDPGPIERRESF